MVATFLALKNWRNFLAVNTHLQARTFVVGPNASGKFDLLDAVKFLLGFVRRIGGTNRLLSSLMMTTRSAGFGFRPN